MRALVLGLCLGTVIVMLCACGSADHEDGTSTPKVEKRV